MDLLGTNLAWIITLLASLAISITALIIIPRERKPTAAMAWLLLISILPFIGILLYLLIGNFRLPKKRMEEQKRVNEIYRERASSQTVADPVAEQCHPALHKVGADDGCGDANHDAGNEHALHEGVCEQCHRPASHSGADGGAPGPTCA